MGTTKVTPSLVFAVTVATIGSFQLVYNTRVINASEIITKDFLNYTLEKLLEDLSSKGLLTTLSGPYMWPSPLLVARLAFSVGLFVNRFGRCNSMLLVNLVDILGGCLMVFAKMAESVEMLILGCLIIGIFCGLCTGFVLMYIREVSPTALQGAFGTLNQLSIVVGILMTQIFGLDIIQDSEELWPGLLGLTIIPAKCSPSVLP